MILAPHKDSNNFILYLIIQLLKLKTVKFYTKLIDEVVKNVVCFEKDIKNIYVNDIQKYKNKIKKVIIPKTVIYIGNASFSFCKLLEEVIIGNNVKIIGHYSFYGCISLKKIFIPPSVKNIFEGAFGGCSNLKKIYIPISFEHKDDELYLTHPNSIICYR